MSETTDFEKAIASGWFNDFYNQDSAKAQAELMGLDFDNVLDFYSQKYHEMEASSHE